MVWKCQNCSETQQDALEVCWQCGAARDGSLDPNFQHADDFEPDIPEEKSQYGLSTLLTLMFAGCLVFALIGSLIQGGPTRLTVGAGLAAFGFLCLQVVSWLLVRRANALQRTIRRSARDTEVERRTLRF